jgi:hypothetical protein
MQPQLGDFVCVRNRRWLVEDVADLGGRLHTLTLAGIDDDTQGEITEIVWSAELDAQRLSHDDWPTLLRGTAEDPETFSAYLRTIKWNTATAADRDLLQAPFRAGIRLDAYQLLPLRKALRLPRVNLLIADDVGLGKTIEAGLVLREMLLRRRIDYMVVAAPAGMVRQWQDELESKFGLAFTIVDRDYLSDLRRERGFGANPWEMGSRFIISHSLLADETYMAGLRDLLGEFRPRALLILDEAHHAAPAHGARYAVDSQFTKAMRALASRFEHRLFLTATPHNGHSNSFSSLLEMLDPQRFTRGVKVRPRDLEPVMVRRLKADLRHFGEPFAERVVTPMVIDDLPMDSPELVLPRMLAAYGASLLARAAKRGPQRAMQARLIFVGLQKRLLSSIEAFARTLTKHRDSLVRNLSASPALAMDLIQSPGQDDDPVEPDEGAATTAATALAEMDATQDERAADLATVDAMLAVAEVHRSRQDCRTKSLADWIRANMTEAGTWNDRRLVIFTEWDATRLWLERRLNEALHDLDPENRIDHIIGATPLDRREALKRAFNADPAAEPIRILVCTDAAREGINLQARCHDLIHFDLPWNPARLEQRNGRIDRKLQPAPQVFCRYFLYRQRPEDIVLEALVRKTELIRTQLGSAGQVLANRISDDLDRDGIFRPDAQAKSISDAADAEGLATAQEEMDDATERRRTREGRNLDELRRLLEQSRVTVGVEPEELMRVAGTALARMGAPLPQTATGDVRGVTLFKLDPADPAFAGGTWAEAFDDLRIRRRERRERLRDYRAAAPVRSIAFRPAVLANGADAADVVQLHLEHRVIRRLLTRFTSQGFQDSLSRCCVVAGPGAQPRVLLLGRLALYGPGASRLHEEIVTVTALWSEATHGKQPLRPLGTRGEETTMAQLDAALRDPRLVAAPIRARLALAALGDATDLAPELESRAAARRKDVEAELIARGETEATSLQRLLEDQRKRIADAAAIPEDRQMSLPGIVEKELAQLRADRRHWDARLRSLDTEIATEPPRVRDSYRVRAARVEPVGLVYLWPATN